MNFFGVVLRINRYYAVFWSCQKMHLLENSIKTPHKHKSSGVANEWGGARGVWTLHELRNFSNRIRFNKEFLHLLSFEFHNLY